MIGTLLGAFLAASALKSTLASQLHLPKFELGMIPAALLATYNIPPPLPQPTTAPTRNTASAAAISISNASVASVSATFSRTAGDYLMVTSSVGNNAGAAPNITGVSGASVTWTKLGSGKTNVSGTRQLQCEMWGGFATSSGTGSVTASYDATVVSGYMLVLAYTGVNTTNPVADTVVQYVNNTATNASPTWTNNCGFNNTLSVVGYAGGVTSSSFTTPTMTNISEVQAGSMAIVAATWNGGINKGAITFTNNSSQANEIFINVNLKGTGGGS